MGQHREHKRLGLPLCEQHFSTDCLSLRFLIVFGIVFRDACFRIVFRYAWLKIATHCIGICFSLRIVLGFAFRYICFDDFVRYPMDT